MREPPTNICPLLAIASIGSTGYNPAACIQDRCALWNYVGLECSLVSIPFAIQEISCDLIGIEGALKGDSRGS